MSSIILNNDEQQRKLSAQFNFSALFQIFNLPFYLFSKGGLENSGKVGSAI